MQAEQKPTRKTRKEIVSSRVKAGLIETCGASGGYSTQSTLDTELHRYVFASMGRRNPFIPGRTDPIYLGAAGAAPLGRGGKSAL